MGERDLGGILGCRAYLPTKLEGVRIYGFEGTGMTPTRLDALPADDRRAALKALRAGEPLEVEYDATVYLQGDHALPGYKPNANGVRFRRSRLARITKTFKGQPALVDHRQWSLAARMGTIVDAQPFELADGTLGMRQTHRIVKPDAAASVLDGTIDRFSIGWDPVGKVVCSVHGGQVLQDCACWPLDVLRLDGKDQIVEYEFQDALGIETSAVNVPAVQGTRIEEVRAALAAEIRTKRSHRPMRYTRLAAALMLTLAPDHDLDEEDAIRSVTALGQRAARAEVERDAAATRATQAETSLAAVRAELATATGAAAANRADQIIASGYESRRLMRTKGPDGAPVPSKFEPTLRKMVETHGADATATYLSTLPVLLDSAPIADSGAGPEPKSPPQSVRSDSHKQALARAAELLGRDPKELEDASY